MNFFPDFSKTDAPDYVVNHERKQLKWFLILCLSLLMLTAGTDFLISLYGKSTITNERNPFMTIEKTPAPLLTITPTQITTPPTQPPAPNPTANDTEQIVNACAELKLADESKIIIISPSTIPSGFASVKIGKIKAFAGKVDGKWICNTIVDM